MYKKAKDPVDLPFRALLARVPSLYVGRGHRGKFELHPSVKGRSKSHIKTYVDNGGAMSARAQQETLISLAREVRSKKE